MRGSPGRADHKIMKASKVTKSTSNRPVEAEGSRDPRPPPSTQSGGTEMEIDDLDDPTMSLNVEEFLIHKDGQKELTPEEEDALLQGGSVDAASESALPPPRK